MRFGLWPFVSNNTQPTGTATTRFSRRRVECAPGKSEKMDSSRVSVDQESPTFNLKAVVKETGLKPDTLRAWERRYELPTPKRTPGGHRLYSQRDIETLKWLVARQEEGLSISRAVNLWNEYLTNGRDPLVEVPLEQPEPSDFVNVVGETLLGLRRAWVEACLAYEEAQAEAIASQAFALYSPETVVLELFQQALAEIGIGWFEGRVTAQQEHFASALAMRRLEGLVAAAPPPTRQGRILVACPPEEEHTFAPLLITLLLRRRGFEALYLGANVPLERMEPTLRATQPDLVLLSAQTLLTAATMLDMAQILSAQGVNIAYGGLVFNNRPRLRQFMPGHFLGTKIDRVAHAVERIIQSGTQVKAKHNVSSAYIDAHAHYVNELAQLEAHIWNTLRHAPIPPSDLARANRDFANSIGAALRLGDITLVGTDIHWFQALLTNMHYRLREQNLNQYMQAYLAAARATLDERGRVLIEWMESVLEDSEGSGT